MAILVVCPNCLTRFHLKEKYAGKQGPCPKCKSLLTIPTLDEIVEIPEPESDQPDANGQPQPKKLTSFKPIERAETHVQPVVAAAVIVSILLALAVALVLRGTDWKSSPLLTFGAIVLAPPLIWGGYTFLREQELQPYQGRELAARVAICAAIYVLLWGLFWGLKHWLLPGDTPLESWNTLFLAGPSLVIGTATATLCLDLDATNGFFHYCLYAGVCMLLRLAMGLSAL